VRPRFMLIEGTTREGTYVVKLDTGHSKTFIVDVNLNIGQRPVSCDQTLRYDGVDLCYVRLSSDCTLVVLEVGGSKEVIGCYVSGLEVNEDEAAGFCKSCASRLLSLIS